MEHLDHLLAETQRLRAAKDSSGFPAKEALLLDGLHPAQRAFVLDPGRRVAALVARRGGKTYGGRARFWRRLLRVPKAQCIYVALTRPQAEELIWEPLKEDADRLEIRCRFNETKLKMTLLANDAELQLVGADDKREIEKQRGRRFHEAGIDEGASHKRDLLEQLIIRILGPGLTDFRGPLWMIGTPGHILSGLFYDVTRPGSKIARPFTDRDNPEWKDFIGWSTHFWSLRDNTAMPHLWEEALLEKASHGWSDDNPIWRREYLGLWAADDTGYVYKYRAYTDSGKRWNSWQPEATGMLFGLPRGHEWRFIYAMDMGWGDPFALQVLAYSETCLDLYQCYEWSKSKATIREIADVLKGLIEKTGYPEAIVGDIAGLGGQVLNELAEVYGIVVQAAEKKSKNDAIELMNSDLVDGRFKVMEGSELETEMLHLQWDETGLKENKAQANHNCDAVIYGRRAAKHQYSEEPGPPPPAPGTREAIELAERQAEEEAAREVTEEDLMIGNYFNEETYGDW